MDGYYSFLKVPIPAGMLLLVVSIPLKLCCSIVIRQNGHVIDVFFFYFSEGVMMMYDVVGNPGMMSVQARKQAASEQGKQATQASHVQHVRVHS